MLYVLASIKDEWLTLWGIADTERVATELVIEKPAQQVQMQKGEQASSFDSSCEVALVSEYLPISSLATMLSSAHGSMLTDRTRTAIMKAKTFFTGAKVILEDVKHKSMFVSLLQTSFYCFKKNNLV